MPAGDPKRTLTGAADVVGGMDGGWDDGMQERVRSREPAAAAMAGLCTTLFVAPRRSRTLAIAGSRRSASVVDRSRGRAEVRTSTTRRNSAGSVTADRARRRCDRSRGVGTGGRVDERPVETEALGEDGRAAGEINEVTVDWKQADPTVRVVKGEIPDASNELDVMVNEDFVKALVLTAGESVPVRMFGPGQFDAVQAGDYRPDGTRYRFRIRGVVRAPDSICTDEVHQLQGESYGTRMRWSSSTRRFERHRSEFLDFGPNDGIELQDGIAGAGNSPTEPRAAASRCGAPPGAGGSDLHGARSRRRSTWRRPAPRVGISLAVDRSDRTSALVHRAEQRIHEEDVHDLEGPRLQRGRRWR